MLESDLTIQYKKGINMPADFLSRSKIEEVSTIDPFSPSLIHEQALDPDMIALRQFHTSSSWPAGTSKSDKTRTLPLLKFLTVRNSLVWVCLDDHEHQRTALYLPPKFKKGYVRSTYLCPCWP